MLGMSHENKTNPGNIMRALLILIGLSHSFSTIAQTEDAIPVTVKPLNEVLIERKLSANAQVVAKNAAQISAEVSAVVTKVHVDVGDLVEVGDVIVTLDAKDWQLQKEQASANTRAAQARLTQAQIRLDRAKELETSQYISADDLLARETDVAVMKADLLRLKVAEKTANRQLAKTKIVAPFAGVITHRQAQMGQLLSIGSPVVRLVQATEIEINAKIPSHLATQLSQASSMAFVSKTAETEVELLILTPVVETQAAIQNARFKPLTSGPLIGQTGQLVWYINGQSLSADLVTKRGGQLGVFVAQGNQAKFIPLVNAQEGRPVTIEGQPSWQVIVGGRERLQDGQAIQVK